jgi:hypothetical protein
MRVSALCRGPELAVEVAPEGGPLILSLTTQLSFGSVNAASQ